jgi:UDP-N-acetyl-2-amino-2-deoxyglucuronate dehydrogenase
VGVVDRYFPEAKYFREIERFDRFLEKTRRAAEKDRVHYVSVCSPNYLHDAHTRLGLRVRAHVICEKPLVIKPWNLDPLLDIEAETGARVYAVLQLRLHPAVQALHAQLIAAQRRDPVDVVLTYVTRRGAWYHASWKGDEARSGGLLTNIGIHFFDMLVWLFGSPVRREVHIRTPERVAGLLELQHARVRWLLSVDEADLPRDLRDTGKHAHRSLTLDGAEFEFSEGFTDLHTAVYRDVLSGGGFGIADARPSIELVHQLRVAEVTSGEARDRHPLLQQENPA